MICVDVNFDARKARSLRENENHGEQDQKAVAEHAAKTSQRVAGHHQSGAWIEIGEQKFFGDLYSQWFDGRDQAPNDLDDSALIERQLGVERYHRLGDDRTDGDYQNGHSKHHHSYGDPIGHLTFLQHTYRRSRDGGDEGGE